MTWPLRICFSLLAALPLAAHTVAGHVSLSGSDVAAVRKGKDFSGVVVWLESTRSMDAPRTAARASRARMEQKGKRFIPHILATQVGSDVYFPNLDPIFHSAFSNFSGQVFDLGLYPPGKSRTIRFQRPGVVRVFCNIHPSMSAVIVVLEHPWFAVSDSAGAFEITDVPAGEYRLRVFHERATAEALRALEHRIEVQGDVALPPIAISETGYLQTPHKNKYGHDYPPDSDDRGAYPADRR